MKSAIAKRRFTHDGVTYQVGQLITLPETQYRDWLAAGMIKAQPKQRNK